VLDDDVNVREKPDVSSPVVAKLYNAVEVYAAEETVNESTIDGQTDRWYYITEPVEGWVFGGWLGGLE
jgi:hypothetical protein